MRNSRRRSATTWTSTTSPDTSPSWSGSPTTTACSRTARTSTPNLHPDTNRMHFIAWDQDFSFGNTRNNGNWSNNYASSGGNRFLSRLYNLDAFRSKYLARMTEFSERLFVRDRFMQQV